MSEPKKVGITKHVLGDEWLLGKDRQDHEWSTMRRDFDRYLVKHDLTLTSKATETTEYDEQRGEVILRRWGYAE